MESKVADGMQKPCSRSCVSLDQVWYTEFAQGDGRWHMGAVSDGWEKQLPLAVLPGEEELKSLAENGIFLAKDQDRTPPLCVMCCGQGSIWPGMGRELYDYFPEARAAMDRLAACTNWDVLALMDEPDVETIGLTQWAQPYLFLVEYAQWSVFLARGLNPACICGHSLGELIALCLAGVYSPETCWYILETRSRHVSELEARSRRETGMMGVYAGLDVIKNLQQQWPDIYISNYNTPEQFIVSGPRETLQEARKYLRKQRIPAVILNIAMAFHHPSMRVLRDMDQRRLNMLDMHPSERPLVSCVTGQDYPRTQEGICSAIMDLDEQTVNWLPCVKGIIEQRGIRHFLELGPQDTLCGLVSAISPDAFCQAASLRGRERDSMRLALARLYSQGLLSHKCIVQAAQDWQPMPEAEPRPPLQETEADRAAEDKTENVGIPAIRELLAKACGMPAESLHGSMNLRFDLNMRSSYFPSLIDEAQKALGVEVAFEDLLNVSTIADLEKVFSGNAVQEESSVSHTALGSMVQRPFLARCLSGGEEGSFAEIAEDPSRPLLSFSAVVVHGDDDRLCACLVRSLASLRLPFIADENLPATKAEIERMGSSVPESTVCSGSDEAPALVLWQGAFDEKKSEAVQKLLSQENSPLVVLFDRAEPESEPESGARAAVRQLVAEKKDYVLDIVLHSSLADGTTALQCGDLLLRELRSGRRGTVHWLPDDKACLLEHPLQDNADISAMVFPERKNVPGRHSQGTLWGAQFSPEAYPSLSGLPKDAEGWMPLPLSMVLEAQCEASLLASPGLCCIGMSDIRIQASGELRKGLVREVQLTTDIRPWLKNDGGMNQLCRVQAGLRDMNRHGRTTYHYTPLGESCVVLAGHQRQVDKLWQEPCMQDGESIDVAGFYQAAGTGQERRFLSSASLCQGHMLEASLADETFLALSNISAYNKKICSDSQEGFLGSVRQYNCALEAILQAVDLARSIDAPSTLCEAVPGLIGFVRFGLPCDGPFTLSLKRSWDQDRVLRYDAQVTNAGGQCLLAVMHIEYNALA